MYDTILVPLDGSELAEVALPYAEELAGKSGSAITLVYVVEPSPCSPDRMYRTYIGQMAQLTRQLAERYVEGPEKKTIKVDSKILNGDAAEEILKYADRTSTSLIVMATHGRSGLKHWSMGSVADKVIRASKHPVWLIRAKGARPDVREKDVLDRALVPLDGSKESEVVIPYIEELASALKAEVTLLQVLPLGYQGIGGEGYEYIYYRASQMESDKAYVQGYLDKIAAQLKEKGVEVKSQVRFGNAAEEIIKLAADIRADVVVMATHGRSGIGRWVLGSVAERILHEGYSPLLLVRSSEAFGENISQRKEGDREHPAASRY